MIHTPTMGSNKNKGEIRKGYTVFLHKFKEDTSSTAQNNLKKPSAKIIDSPKPAYMPNIRPNKNLLMTINREHITDNTTLNINPSIMKMDVESKKYNKLVELQNQRPSLLENASTSISIVSIIPLVIYQTWYTKNLPPVMRDTVKKLKLANPQFEHVLYDDDECRKFIQENFDEDVVNAFDTLIPGAYKADLWRYCILYKNGGIYIDIKYKCINDFTLIELTDKEYFTKDIEWNDKRGIYNALMVCLPGNQKCWDCIQQICENVKNRFYGDSSLEPTGPQLLAKYFTDDEYNSQSLRHDMMKNIKDEEHYYIFKDRQKILVVVDGYRKEQAATQNVGHYNVLWDNQNIYR